MVTLVDSDFFGQSSNYVLEINILEGKYAGRSVTSDMYKAVRQTVQFTVENSSIRYGVVRHYDTNKAWNCSNLNTGESNSWIVNNDELGDGVYVWSVNCDDNGRADPDGGWQEGRVRSAFNPYSDDNNRRYVANIASHEGLHPHLYGNSCSRVVDNEHLLGASRTTTTGEDKWTPMATGGNPRNGNCWTDAARDGFTNNPTNCTLRALENSRDHERGDH